MIQEFEMRKIEDALLEMKKDIKWRKHGIMQLMKITYKDVIREREKALDNYYLGKYTMLTSLAKQFFDITDDEIEELENKLNKVGE